MKAAGRERPGRRLPWRSNGRGTKPYRLYRGGRVKGSVLERSARPAPKPTPAPGASRPRRRRIGLWLALAVVGVLLLGAVWGVLGYLSFSDGVEKANARLPGPRAGPRPPRRLAPPEPATILVVGTDGGKAPGRGDARRPTPCSCCGPTRGRIASRTSPSPVTYASRSPATAPGRSMPRTSSGARRSRSRRSGADRPAGAPRGRRRLRRLPGADRRDRRHRGNVPRPILSNKFDCPYSGERCREWEGWRFAKGSQHMDGRRALVYSRIRTNQLDPSETDIARGGRQQAVAEAVGDEIASFSTFLRLPSPATRSPRRCATDLSAWELMQLGWVRFRADTSKSLHCRLGGEPASLGGVGAHRLGGERRRDLDVPPPLGGPRAAEGHALRTGLHPPLTDATRRSRPRTSSRSRPSAGLSVVFSEEEGESESLRGFAFRPSRPRAEPLKCTARGRGLLHRPRAADGAPPAAGPSHLLEGSKVSPFGHRYS